MSMSSTRRRKTFTSKSERDYYIDQLTTKGYKVYKLAIGSRGKGRSEKLTYPIEWIEKYRWNPSGVPRGRWITGKIMVTKSGLIKAKIPARGIHR